MPKRRRRLTPSDYIVGWICALPVELAAAKKMMDEEHEPLPQSDMNPITVYTLGRIGSHNVVMACLPAGRIGLNTMGAMAKEMSYAFPSIRFSLLVGIGGGVPSKVSDVRLGDIVVSQPTGQHGGVVQYDSGKATPTGFELSGSLNAPPNILLSAVSSIRAHHAHKKNSFEMYLDWVVDGSEFAARDPASDVLFKSTYNHVAGYGTCESCNMAEQVHRKPRDGVKMVVHYGTVASGNQVIKDGTTRDALSAQLGGVLCFEMEAAGIMNTFPCLVIRGICDYADSHKNKTWQGPSAAVAAAYAKELLSFVPDLDELRRGDGGVGIVHEGSYSRKRPRMLPTPSMDSYISSSPLQDYEEMSSTLSQNGIMQSTHWQSTALINKISEFDDPGSGPNGAFFGEPATLPCEYLPFRAFPHFWGRQEDLDMIDEYLDYDPSNEQLRSLAIWGVPGVGKSQTAFAYAKRKKEELDAVFWVNAATELQLDEGFSEIAIKLKLPKASVDSSQAHNIYQLGKWLSQTKAKWLLVFDNVDNSKILKNYWPNSQNGSILITCRSSTTAADPATNMMHLEPFDDEEGARLLLLVADRKTYSEKEEAASRELSKQVGGLALAIVTLAHQIKVKRTKVEKFLSSFTSDYREILEDSERSGIYYQNSVPVTFQLSFRSLQENTRGLLAIFSLLAPNNIPETIFAAEFAPGDVDDYSPFCFLKRDKATRAALQELIDRGLVFKDIESDLFTVHRLIQLEFRDCMNNATLLGAFKITTGLLYEVFPKAESGNPLRAHWNTCKSLIHHVQTLAERYEQMFLVKHLEGKDTPQADIELLPKLLASAAWYLHEGNSYHTALQLIGIAFRSCKSEDSLTYARLSNVAGCITSEQGKFDLALSHYEKALDIRKRLLPRDHGELADTYNNIALCYQAMDRMAEAFSHLRMAIEIDEMKPEESREQVGHLRHLNLADMYMQQGELHLVREEIDRGRDYAEQYFGSNSHFVADADSSYGHLAELENDLELALKYYESAFNVYKTESAVSPAVSMILYRIGRLLVKQGNFPGAVTKLEQSLLVSEYNEPMRGDKGNSARIMRKLADALKGMGKVREGERMRVEAEKIRKQLQGIRYNSYSDDDRSWDALVDVIFR